MKTGKIIISYQDVEWGYAMLFSELLNNSNENFIPDKHTSNASNIKYEWAALFAFVYHYHHIQH